MTHTADTTPMGPYMVNRRNLRDAAHACMQQAKTWDGGWEKIDVSPSPGPAPPTSRLLLMTCSVAFQKSSTQNGPARTMDTHREGKSISKLKNRTPKIKKRLA